MDGRDTATALLMSQLDPSKAGGADPSGKINLNLARTHPAGTQSELRSGFDNSIASHISALFDPSMTSSLRQLKTGQMMPVVSCLCKELELTPEQFG